MPSVISLAFFGGLWGIALAYVLRGQRGVGYWLMAVALGAVLPTLVALLLVFPLKGMAFAAGGDLRVWIIALILNGAWGLGLGLLLKLRVGLSG